MPLSQPIQRSGKGRSENWAGAVCAGRITQSQSREPGLAAETMNSWRYPYWHNILLAALLTGIAADFIFGIDTVLNMLSVAIAVVVAMALLSLLVLAGIALAWITVRDALEGLRSDRRDRLAWRWRLVAYAGMLGIVVDGAVGAWNVYAQHVLFSVAVREIPFSGVPVWLLLASYPLKWLEQAAMRQAIA